MVGWPLSFKCRAVSGSAHFSRNLLFWRSRPRTRVHVNGFKVDFYWPELKLVVEADSLRYHRTAAQQARDRLRDQRHIAAGLIPLRFTHHQIAHERKHVEKTLRAVAERRT